MQSFAGKTVLITGASEGIGRALALQLAAEGTKLVLNARDAARLRRRPRVRRARRGGGHRSRRHGARADCERFVARAVERFGGIDVLVNNAGMTMWARFDAVADFERPRTAAGGELSRRGVHDRRGAAVSARAARGLIVAVASIAGLTGVPERTGYAASKHAMVGFFESLRIELRSCGVGVDDRRAGLRRVSEMHKARRRRRTAVPLGKTPDGGAAHHERASSARA